MPPIIQRRVRLLGGEISSLALLLAFAFALALDLAVPLALADGRRLGCSSLASLGRSVLNQGKLQQPQRIACNSWPKMISGSKIKVAVQLNGKQEASSGLPSRAPP